MRPPAMVAILGIILCLAQAILACDTPIGSFKAQCTGCVVSCTTIDNCQCSGMFGDFSNPSFDFTLCENSKVDVDDYGKMFCLPQASTIATSRAPPSTTENVPPPSTTEKVPPPSTTEIVTTEVAPPPSTAQSTAPSPSTTTTTTKTIPITSQNHPTDGPTTISDNNPTSSDNNPTSSGITVASVDSTTSITMPITTPIAATTGSGSGSYTTSTSGFHTTVTAATTTTAGPGSWSGFGSGSGEHHTSTSSEEKTTATATATATATMTADVAQVVVTTTYSFYGVTVAQINITALRLVFMNLLHVSNPSLFSITVQPASRRRRSSQTQVTVSVVVPAVDESDTLAAMADSITLGIMLGSILPTLDDLGVDSQNVEYLGSSSSTTTTPAITASTTDANPEERFQLLATAGMQTSGEQSLRFRNTFMKRYRVGPTLGFWDGQFSFEAVRQQCLNVCLNNAQCNAVSIHKTVSYYFCYYMSSGGRLGPTTSTMPIWSFLRGSNM